MSVMASANFLTRQRVKALAGFPLGYSHFCDAMASSLSEDLKEIGCKSWDSSSPTAC
jgi:hypothetical protein